MIVPLLDLTRLDSSVRDQLGATFQRVLHSGQYILGAEVTAFESECAAYLGVKHAIAVSSGSDALLMALMALDIGPGDEVICPSYTFFATGGSIARLGATPVFVDSAPCCYNLDPTAVAAAITPRTRAIMPVHLFGQSADLRPLLDLAAQHGLPIIEDAAQAIGTQYEGRAVGTWGQIGCYSFFPTKNLGALGDAGLIVTSDDALADRLRMLRVHGSRQKYLHEFIGGNFRIDALQAALLRVKLPHLEQAHARRATHARHYTERLIGAGVAAYPVEACVCRHVPREAVTAPLLLPYSCQPHHIYNQFVVRIPGAGRRDAMRSFLTAQQIGTEIYYPRPLHQQPCFAHLPSAPQSLPWAETFAEDSLALPIFPELRIEEIDYVCDQLTAFLQSA